MPPAYEVLLLNTAIPQIQAAQSGDTYVVPRDIAINATAIISANSATDALRITQTGAGNAILVEDSANPDSSPFVVTAIGNVGIGTTSPIALAANYTTVDIRGTTGGALRFGNATDSAYIYSDSNETNIATATNKRMLFSINTSEKMRLDTSGNLGLGATPSAWGAGIKALQIGTGASLINAGVSGDAYLGQNVFFNGTNNLYINTQSAGQYAIASGVHTWYNAPSGTANSAVVAASKSYTVVALGTTTLAQWQASFNDASNNPLTVTPTLGQVLTSLSSPVSPIPNGGLVTQNISFTQAMTLDTSGNLVVGATSANARLDVVGGSIRVNEDGIGTKIITVRSDFAGLGPAINVTTSDPLLFLTDNTERARITSGGYFKASDNGTYLNAAGTYHEINQTANDNVLFIRSTDTAYSVDGVQLRFSRNTTNNSFYVLSYYNATAAAYKFRVADSGDVTNTNGTYGTISDAKMKTDIVDAGSQWADIKALRFRKFKMKDDPSGLVQLGVVAQEVELTSPGLVDEHADKDAEGDDLGTTTKSVKTSVLLMKAAVALQEAMARIEKLEAEVAALKGA